MAVGLKAIDQLTPIPGIEWGVAVANIRYQDRPDLAVMRCVDGSIAGGVFTQNRFRAAPVEVAEAHCGAVRGLVVNSGNANAATGDLGVNDAKSMCSLVAEQLQCDANEVLPFSTGVIGEPLPMDRVKQGIADACLTLRADGWNAAAEAIMTTDTQPKGISKSFLVQGKSAQATGIVKGSGMIRPDMATMLAFLGTDVALTAEVAKQVSFDLAERSFNRLTIDGDTSTNDCFVVIASGMYDGELVDSTSSSAYRDVLNGLTSLVEELAILTVRDGEGATKFVTIEVSGGRTERECLDVAYTVAHSPLVKTAIFAGDPNWGRFCMAIGRAGIDDLNPYAVSVSLDDYRIATDGQIDPEYIESQAAKVMVQDEFTVRIHLNRGSAKERVWTSDLSYEYVKINAEYRT